MLLTLLLTLLFRSVLESNCPLEDWALFELLFGVEAPEEESDGFPPPPPLEFTQLLALLERLLVLV
jgi:hypothetical protein